MSATEVLREIGTFALAKLTVALLLFLVLHLARLPLIGLVRLLTLGMSRMDRLVLASATTPTAAQSRQQPLRHNETR